MSPIYNNGVLLMMGIIGSMVAVAVLMGPERSLAFVFGPPTSNLLEFENLQRDDRPNQFLAAPEGFCKTAADRITPAFDVSVAQLKQSWIELMQNQPRLKATAKADSGKQLEYVQRSRWLRFPDSISVRFIAIAPKRSTLAIFSQSQIGYSDFGVNQNRVESWLKQLTDRLPTTDYRKT